MPNSFHERTAFIITQLAALLQLKYQTQTPFAILPTTMFVAVSSIMLYYLLHICLIPSPTSRFAATAHHVLVCSAYVAVSTLAAALFPDHATPFIYTIFGLLSAGQVLYAFRHKLAADEDEDKDEDEDEEDKDSKFEYYRRRVRRFFRNISSNVSKFLGQQPPPLTLPILIRREFSALPPPPPPCVCV